MSVIGGQNTPTTNGLAYIIDFNNNYISGSSTVTPILYVPTASQFTGSVPNLVNGQVQFTGSSVLRSFQTFPGFSAVQGNMTLMFSGESKNSNVLFTQDGTVAVVSTTSSIGYGVPAGNLGRNFPNVGFDHVTLRFSSSSVDCFINGIPVSASGMFPTVPSSSTFTDFKIGGNYLTSWTGSLSGSLGQLMVYTRPLSDDEIYSNYLIQARRYGLSEAPKPYTVDSSVYVYSQAAGITDTVTLNALNTFVQGLKSASLWDKMVAIYPFIGTNPSASRLNLKDVSLNTTQVNYSGSWSTSLSGSRNNNTASYGILSNVRGTYVHPLINSQSIHLSYLSYDTPTSGGYLMGVEQIPGLPGDIAQPAAAYSVRKVRTAYTGSAMTVRRDFDDVTFDVGFDASGNLNTGSLLTNMTASGIVTTLPGDYSGLAAAYSLRKVSSSYSGYAIEVQSGSVSQSIGFDVFGNLDTGSLLTFVGSGNAYVKTWYDQSGNNRHATQTVAANQPQIVSNGVIVTQNGRPTIDHTSTTTLELASDLNLGKVHSMFGVVKFDVYGKELFGKAAGFTYGIYQDATNNYYSAQSSFASSSGVFGLNFSLLAIQRDNTTVTQYKNSSILGGTMTLTGANNDFLLRSLSGEQNTTYNLDGKLSEVLIYSGSITSSRGLIEDNINGYYNIFTQSLASGSGYVTRWYDQSGNNRHATQTATGSQPLIVLSGSIYTSNNKPAINIVNSTRFLTASVYRANSTDATSWFITYQLTSLSRQGIVSWGVTRDTGINFEPGADGAGISIHKYSAYAYGPNSSAWWSTNQSLFSWISPGGLVNASTLYLNSDTVTNPVFKWGSNSNITVTGSVWIGLGSSAGASPVNAKISEVILYSSNQSSNRQSIEQDINSYFNIYTPLAYNLNTNSLSLFSSPTTVAGAANNVASASFTTGGPLGLITVSRTGSSNYTLWKNRVPNKVTLSPSTASSSEIYLNAANVNNTLFSGSQNNIAYASVGAGLTDSETTTYYDLVNNLQTSLGRGVSNPNTFITVWNTLLTGSGTSNSSSIVLPLFGTQAITASWGDGTVSLISSSTQVDRTHSYAVPGIYTVSITGRGQGFRFQGVGDTIKLVDIPQWGSISGSANGVFWGCSNLVGTAPDYPPVETTDMFAYFIGMSKFNGAVGNWDVSKVTSFYFTFSETSTFNQPLGSWNTSAATNMNQMFYNAVFNQNIGSWNVGNVTDMGAMFNASPRFNNGGSPSINNWNVSNVTNMASMFGGTSTSNSSKFNQPIGSWNVGNVTSMASMFDFNTAFNQDIGAWNVSKVTNMSQMFNEATSFNNSGSNSINNWRPVSCSNFTNMFFNNSAFNQPIGGWQLGTGSHIPSTGINMSSMFNNADAFNQNIGSWDVSKVTNMSSMFQNNGGFNNSGSSDINNWRPISCSNFTSMFQSSVFNQPIGNWPLSASSINMTQMFAYSSFNQNIGSWNTSNVTNTTWMFLGATSFNQNIGSWNTGNITTMVGMFESSPAFNNGGSSDINNWNTNKVTNMTYMFYNTPFNQPIGNWDVSNVTNMNGMFRSANAFNQDIGSWNVGNVTNFGDFMANKTTYSYLHTIYDGWINNKLQPQRTITFNTIKYSGSAAEGRALLTRTYATGSITAYSADGPNLALTCSFNHNVVAGNKVFISGSSDPSINGVQTVQATSSATMLTLALPTPPPSVTGDRLFTGYGWSITDGGVV